jgi:hypothetical protein
MQKTIKYQAEEVTRKLEKLGLTAEQLTTALLAGVLAWSSSTPNDPPSAAGFNLWARIVRVLRENLVVFGWSKSDEKNFSTVKSPDEKMSIAVFAGCSNTGKQDCTPSTKRSRGKCTVDAVLSNQMFLPLTFSDGSSAYQQKSESQITWVLLHHIDHERNEIRSELSLPASMGQDGFIVQWLERIILPVQTLDTVPPIAPPDFGPEITIEIQRRA